MDKSILGIFLYVDNMLAAAQMAKSMGHKVTMISPVPLVHEVEHVFGHRKDYLRYFTFFGAVSGLVAGTLLTFITSILYVLPRGGRPIFTVTPTMLISFETTILGGVILTLLGFLYLAGLPVSDKKEDDVTDMADIAIDSFGLLIDIKVDTKEGMYEEIEKALKEYGAKEVKRVEK